MIMYAAGLIIIYRTISPNYLPLLVVLRAHNLEK